MTAEREIDPITDGLRMLTYTDLIERLQKARRTRDEGGNSTHLRENALETIPRVESEMVRRGMEIPPEPTTERAQAKKPARKATKK